MEKSALIMAAIVPCMLLLSIFVFALRKCVPPVSFREMLICFTLGILSCIPLLLWNLTLGGLEQALHYYPVSNALFGSVVMAAIPEEMCRYLILRWRLSRLPFNHNLMKCMLLGSIVGLGFGTLEHLKYCYLQGWPACWERLPTAVLIHTMAGSIIGFFVGQSIVKRQINWGIIGVCITIALHSLHNVLFGYYELTLLELGYRFYWTLRFLFVLAYALLVAMLYRHAKKGNHSNNN